MGPRFLGGCVVMSNSGYLSTFIVAQPSLKTRVLPPVNS
jgi:hypothetical protein